MIGLYSQAIYVDPAVTAATTLHATQIDNEQKKTNNILTQIKTAEVTINAQLAEANKLQQKIYDGLSNVSSLLNDAFTVKQIYEDTEMIVKRVGLITQFAAKNPQFSVFALKEAKEFKRRCLLLSADVTSTLTGGKFNLMNAGQRRELLRDIRTQTSLLASHAWLILFSMEQAKRIGFWKALNPFQKWVNRDSKIAKDIINRSKYL